jgi:hypothetical protein
MNRQDPDTGFAEKSKPMSTDAHSMKTGIRYFDPTPIWRPWRLGLGALGGLHRSSRFVAFGGPAM